MHKFKGVLFYSLLKKNRFMNRKTITFRKTLAYLPVVFLVLSILGCGTKNTPPGKVSYNHLTRLPLGNVTAQGWLKTQLERNKAGMGGHLDELEPEMIGKPF